MPRNDAAACSHVCPHIGIHAIDIAQPPGIGTSPIDDIAAHQATVTAALAANSIAEVPKKTPSLARLEIMADDIARLRLRSGSALAVLVMAAPPDLAGLVAPLRRPVQPRIDAPDGVHAPRIAGIGVVDGAVLHDEG